MNGTSKNLCIQKEMEEHPDDLKVYMIIVSSFFFSPENSFF